ncbi:MAG: protein kinase, partial [Lentisphaerae bacterium]|nr:protein kinase [Lentisphaerota bacterium]
MTEEKKIRRVIGPDDAEPSHSLQRPADRVRLVSRKRPKILAVRTGEPSPAPRLVSPAAQTPVSLEDYQAKLGTGRYRLQKLIAGGGVGRVFRAYDELLGMPIAVKCLHPHLLSDPEHQKALTREARLAMQLAHPHIVRLFNLVETNGAYFLIMEYVEGRTFRDVLKEYGRLAPDTVAQVVRACSDGLSHAHR